MPTWWCSWSASVGSRQRWADDQLAQRFGIPGDEGLGPAGAANALRTLPVIDQLGAEVARLAPQATVLNLVAPLGLTTRALLGHGLDAVGVCELPGVTHHALAEALGEATELAYGGFNHLGWFWPVEGSDGARRSGRVVERLAPLVAAGLVDPGVLGHFEAVPLKYYYWLHEPAAAERLGIPRDPYRSRDLLAGHDRARAELARADLAGPPAAVSPDRPTPWFDLALVPMLSGLLGGPAWLGFANLANLHGLADFDPQVVVEVPVLVDAGGVIPQPSGRDMPPVALAFSQRVERSELLLYQAWQHDDRERVAQALIEGPHQLDPTVAHLVAQALGQASSAVGSSTRPSPATTSTPTNSAINPTIEPRIERTTDCPTEVIAGRGAVAITRFETTRATTTDYLVGAGAWAHPRLAEAVADRPVVAVIDRLVIDHHGPAVDALLATVDCRARLVLQAGEQIKSQARLAALLEQFEACELPKHGVALGIGGGTVCDLVSLAALLMRRSVPLVLLPTTLLAQVDAAVGGKNGIDSPTTKNVFGHFHHPVAVASDPAVLATLDHRQLVAGTAECIKVFAVADADALDRHADLLTRPDRAGPAWTPIVIDAQDVKLELLADDPYEESSRRLLNYGHAFAHLLEERSGYQLLHGEAVLFGMMIENEISAGLGIATPAVDAVQQLIVDLVPATAQVHWLGFEAIVGDLDKIRQMRRAAMNLVCLEAPGVAVIVDDAPNPVVASAMRRCQDRLARPSVPAEART